MSSRFWRSMALFLSGAVSRMRYCLILLLLSTVSAYSFNHPEIAWKSVSTRHFIIHYYDKTEPAVYATWKIAEEAYDVLSKLYGYKLKEKLNVMLADYDDYSNGWASWGDRSIGIWIPDADFDLRGNSTWLRNVLTHEITHILSMEKEKGMQLIAWTFHLDYESPSYGLTLTEPVSFMSFVPMWFAEGTAQMGAERLGNDCWDSRRDMVMRCAALDNKLLSLEEMGHFSHDWVRNEMVYNQGYAFIRHIEKRYGEKKVAAIWKRSRERKLWGLNFASTFSDEFGISLDKAYSLWRDSLKAAAEARKPENPTRSTTVFGGATLNKLPRVSPDGRYMGFLTNHKDDSRRTDLVILSQNGDIEARIRYARTTWAFSHDSKKVYYVKTRHPNREGSFLNDLFSCDLSTRKETRETFSARIYDVAFDKGGAACCIRYRNGAFGIERFMPDSKKFTMVVEGKPVAPFKRISFSPNSSDTIVASRLVAGKADIFIISLKDGSMMPLVASEAQEINPHWGSDNRIYFSADYDGIYNVYSIGPDGTLLKRHTSVTGGAFYPVRAHDGQLIIAEYGSSGFRIAQCPGAGSEFEMPNTELCVFKPIPEPRGKVTIKAKDYKPRLLRPMWQIVSEALFIDSTDAFRKSAQGELDKSPYHEMDRLFSTTLLFDRTDAVGRKYMAMGASGALIPTKLDLSGNDTSNAALTKRMAPAADISLYRALAAPHHVRRSRSKQRAPLLPSIEQRLNSCASAMANGSESDSASDSTLIPLPILIPFVSRYNYAHTATLGLDVQALLYMMVPASILAYPSMAFHVARDVYVGAGAEIEFAPMALFAGGGGAGRIGFPMWLQWLRSGYYNEDLQYNYADITQMDIVAVPQVVPFMTTYSTTSIGSFGIDTTKDTTYSAEFMLMGGAFFRHGFPVLRYASLALRTSDFFYSLTEEFSDPAGLLDSSSSSFYLQCNAGAEFTFPLIRNINRGTLYSDNLYGSLSYDLALHGDRAFWSSPDSDIFSNPQSDTGHVVMLHTVGARLDFGFRKQYMFSRLLSIGAQWEFVRKQLFVSFRLLV